MWLISSKEEWENIAGVKKEAFILEEEGSQWSKSLRVGSLFCEPHKSAIVSCMLMKDFFFSSFYIYHYLILLTTKETIFLD